MPRKRILIVDDEPTITHALASLFTQAGYDVFVAHSGLEALAQLTANPDLVILDLLMPGLDGYAVCRKIRELPAYVPIMMLTAKDAPGDRTAGLELGADVYFTKPFEPGELLAQVHALFRAWDHQDRDQRPLTCGPIQLFEAQHHVTVNGNAVELAPKEYELLRFLMCHPGRVFGRETLLREVWGYEFEGDSRAVDTAVQRLRAKIEADPARPALLCTVRGFGYRLVEPGEP